MAYPERPQPFGASTVKSYAIPFVRSLLLLSLPASAAFAGLITRPVSFGNGADAYVQGSNANTNFGASGVLTTRNNAGNASNNYKVYLRFDLSAISLNLAQATNVTLKFSSITTNTAIGFSLFAIPDALPGDQLSGWSESGITYTNAPATPASTTDLGFITASPGDENGNYAVSLGSLSNLTTGGGAVHSFSSAGLLDLIRNDTNDLVTIALRRTDAKGIIQLASDENTLGYLVPTLEIEAPGIVAVPEPGTAIVGIGLLATALLRRRRH
jgi:hypothetical protein